MVSGEAGRDVNVRAHLKLSRAEHFRRAPNTLENVQMIFVLLSLVVQTFRTVLIHLHKVVAGFFKELEALRTAVLGQDPVNGDVAWDVALGVNVEIMFEAVVVPVAAKFAKVGHQGVRHRQREGCFSPKLLLSQGEGLVEKGRGKQRSSEGFSRGGVCPRRLRGYVNPS